MGLLSIFKKKDASPEPPKAAAPQKTADVAPKATETKKEVKPVADKITLGYTHVSGCTGCTVALADNYAGLLTLLDKYVDLKYMPTLADARHIQKVDVSFVEGSVCINDKLAVEEIKETREKSTIVVALGACACYGNITRFCRGGQQNQPAHEAFLPINELIKVDVFIPGCAPTPQLIRNVAVMAYLLLKGTKDQKDLATAYLKPLMALPVQGTACGASTACFCDLMTNVIDQGLCMGCGSCASACPVNAITHEYGKPQGERDLCIKCGACYNQCPRSWYSFDVVSNYEAINEAIMAALQ
jgi:coenzyme F420 hydrogenase subunit gamma